MNSSTIRGAVTVADTVTIRVPLTLDELQPGSCATISHIENGELANRMSDMGLFQGATVRCELISLLGDPVAYRIIDKQAGRLPLASASLIALRRSDAEHIRLVRDQACESDTTRRREGRALWD